MASEPRRSLPGFDGFEAFYRSEVRPLVSDAEVERRELERASRRRRKRLKRSYWVLLLAATIAYLGFFAAWVGSAAREAPLPDPFVIVVAGLAIYLVPLTVVSGLHIMLWAALVIPSIRRLEAFGSEFSGRLAGRICAFFSLRYDRHCDGGPFPAARFVEYGLTSRVFTKLEDHIQGEHRGIGFQIADSRTRYDRKNDRELHAVLMVFSFPKRFSGVTRVLKDALVLEKVRSLFVRDERVELEDPRFERIFEVYSTDQVEARYLLTPTFMERTLMLIRRVRARGANLVFADDRLHMAFTTATNWLDLASMERTLCDRRRIDRMLDDLGLVYQVVETLEASLRTRTRV